MATEGALFVIGNPLLDISAHVDVAYLEKYNLKPNNAILAEPSHLPIYDEIQKQGKVEYIAGGAAQNSARVAQWLIGTPRSSVYVGCIGNDANGKTLKSTTEAAGVMTQYLVDENTPTGTCAVLITDKERSLCTNLGAANNYKKAHIESPALQQILEKAQVFYSTGYFITVSPDSLVHIGEHAAKTNKPFMFNLAAPFVIQFFWDAMATVLPYVDVIFSNEDEAKVFGQKQGWGEDLPTIAQKLGAWNKVNTKRPRTVVFTQGAAPTVVFHDGQITTYAALRVEPSEIVDLNGAGDSFVGGFLAGHVLGKSLEQSIKAGHYAASEVIRRSGCTLPEKPVFSF
jgi:adenosine kinase